MTDDGAAPPQLEHLAKQDEGGSMKAIAVGSPERLPDFPNLPAAAEILPGFNARGWAALVAPVGTPDAIVNKVSESSSIIMLTYITIRYQAATVLRGYGNAWQRPSRV